MNIFYDRQETEQSVLYVEKKHSLYFVVLIAIVSKVFEAQIFSYTEIDPSLLFGGALLCLLICRLVFMASMRKEIAIAMATGKVEKSGSRFNLTSQYSIKIIK